MNELVKHMQEALQFPGGYHPSAYLNQDQIKEAFIAEIGEIKSQTEQCGKSGNIGADLKAWVANVSGKVPRETGTTLEITVDQPETKALLLRATAARQHRISDPCQGKVEDTHYVEVRGITLFTRPPWELPPRLKRQAVVDDLLTLAKQVESERAYREKDLRELDRERKAFTAVLRLPSCSVACIVNDRWLNRGIITRFNGHVCRIFGTLQHRITEPYSIVLIAPLAIWVQPPS